MPCRHLSKSQSVICESVKECEIRLQPEGHEIRDKDEVHKVRDEVSEIRQLTFHLRVNSPMGWANLRMNSPMGSLLTVPALEI